MATADAKTPEENYATTDAKTPEEDNFEKAYDRKFKKLCQQYQTKDGKYFWNLLKSTDYLPAVDHHHYVKVLRKALHSKGEEVIKAERKKGVDRLIAKRLADDWNDIPENLILDFIKGYPESKQNKELQKCLAGRDVKDLCLQYNALKELHEPFIEADSSGCPAEILTREQVLRKHEIVAKTMPGIEGGKIRKEPVAAQGYILVHFEQNLNQLTSKLEALMEFVRKQYVALSCDTKEENLVKIIILVTFFLGEFLRIHPFSDGNGRIARFMTNIILSSVAAAPICFYFGSEGETKRKYYLNSLAEIHQHDSGSPLENWPHLLLGVLHNLYSVQTEVSGNREG